MSTLNSKTKISILILLPLIMEVEDEFLLPWFLQSYKTENLPLIIFIFATSNWLIFWDF
jgi:hypothetical protein